MLWSTRHAARAVVCGIAAGFLSLSIIGASGAEAGVAEEWRNPKLLYRPNDNQHLQTEEDAKRWVVENADIVLRAIAKHREQIADEELLFNYAIVEWTDPAGRQYVSTLSEPAERQGRFAVRVPVVKKGSHWIVYQGRVVVGFQRLIRTSYDDHTERSVERVEGKRVVRTNSKRSETQREIPVGVSERMRPTDRPEFPPLITFSVDRWGGIYY